MPIKMAPPQSSPMLKSARGAPSATTMSNIPSAKRDRRRGRTNFTPLCQYPVIAMALTLCNMM
jgi:hypothetical protein